MFFSNKWLMALALFTVSNVPANAMNEKAEWCEEQWKIVSANNTIPNQEDYSALLAKWKEYGAECTGTVAYEARLSTIYSLSQNPDKAREILRAVNATESDYRHLVDLALLQAETTEVMYGELSRGDVVSLEKKYLDFVKKYPTFYDGHGMLGSIQTILGKYDRAISSLEFALQSSMELWSVYRNLTICYAEVGDYERAFKAADAAYVRNSQITADPYYMYAYAKASAGIGKIKSAETALKIIAAKVPEVRSHPGFKDAVDFVLARKADGEVSN